MVSWCNFFFPAVCVLTWSSYSSRPPDLWLVVFSDVTIRCQRTGVTDIPGGFSRDKEKQGKQGQTKRKGRLRNLYRFIKVGPIYFLQKRAIVADFSSPGRAMGDAIDG